MKTQFTPPKPAIALRVGVTGHRKSRLDPAQIERINAQVAMVLTTAEAALTEAHKRYAREYAETAPLCYFVSALADGADTLAAKQALKNGWRLLAPLPFSVENYSRDFSDQDKEELESLLSQADSVAELDGVRDGAASEDRAYLQAGVTTVSQSDFVIAIWDGEDARGIAGTAMVKEEALAVGKPVVWINAVKDTDPVFMSEDGHHVPFSDETAHMAIDAMVAPPGSDEIEHAFSGKQTHALSAYHEFCEERAHGFNWGSFFQFWEKAFAGKWPFDVKLSYRAPSAEIAKASQSTLAEKLKASAQDQRIFNETIIPRFVWADHLAIHYGNLYRSSYFFNYLFAAMAVFLALFDLIAGGMGFGSKTIWIGLEVTIIVSILGVTTAGKRGRWHEKWIDYRQLAEEMRQHRLYHLTLGRSDQGDDFSQGEGAEAASWVDWYFAATRREAGMASGSFDHNTIKSIAATILEEEIRPQIAYHNHKAEVLHKMEHRLHHLGEFAFAMTLLVCLVYLSLVFLKSGDFGAVKDFAYKTEKLVKNGVTMMTGFLPALGAAFFGIRVQGEFGSTAERSHATAAQLQNIAQKFEPLARSETPRLEILRLRVAEAARAMLMENTDWRLLYISKPLNLPG
ncbi:Uncharacterized protein SCF082_LOCUS24125 [Durusdinium trenchii]|uniref:SMODS and SLOG-associating 2TM effector domain-containing protein n=1 Tax=Durusdinium trenchii TaxID=1381693 RepID=A0ABP0LJJ0_9DINO